MFTHKIANFIELISIRMTFLYIKQSVQTWILWKWLSTPLQWVLYEQWSM